MSTLADRAAPFIPHPTRALRVTSLLVALVAAALLLSWHLHITAALQWSPGTGALKYNTALCLLLCGLGAWILTGRYIRWAALPAALAGSLALGSLFEYVRRLKVSLGELFLKDYLLEDAAHPGRMALLSAICLVLCAIGLMAAAFTQASGRGLRLLALLAVAVMLISGATFLGYVLNIDADLGWGAYTRMALPTAALLFILATALVQWGWRRGQSRGVDLARWLPATASVTVMGLVALGASSRQDQLENAVDWGKHSYEVLLTTQSFLAQIQDVQRGVHRYIQFDQPGALESYRSAAAQAPRTLATLVTLTQDNPLQQARLKSLATDMQGTLNYARRLMAARETSGKDAATRLEDSGIGRELMDRTRDDIQHFSDAERAILTQRNGIAERNFRRTGELTIGAIVLAAGLLAFAHFLTDRELVRRRRQQAELHASEDRFRRAFDDAPIGMALVSPDGRWLKVNRVLCEMLGYAPEELLEKSLLHVKHPDDRQDSREHMRDAKADAGRVYQMEKRYLHRNGSSVYALLSLSPARDQAGALQYFIAQIEDVTQRRQVERIKKEFVSTVSHELRTPLTSIHGSLGLLAAGVTGALTEKSAALVKIAHQNSERLVRIINDILDIEKIESGKLELHCQNLLLNALLQQSIDVNQPYADKYQVRFTLQPLEDEVAVFVDADRFMQVMANLLSNAAKFSPAGAGVEIRASRHNSGIRVEVEDHGSGIPEDFRARVFEKFAQADGSSTRRFEGTGLGLSITRQLIELMGGTVGFHTRLGEGTTFYIDLPCASESASDRERIAELS